MAEDVKMTEADTAAPSVTIDDLMATRPVGRPKSSRVWKLPRERASASNLKARLKSNSYKIRMEQRDKERKRRQIIDQLKSERNEENEARRAEMKRRSEQREKNAIKSSKVQVIKDTSKIKKMSKRQRKLVMTAAQFQKLQAGL